MYVGMAHAHCSASHSAPGLTLTSMTSPAMGAATEPILAGSALSRSALAAGRPALSVLCCVRSVTSTTRGMPLDSKNTSLWWWHTELCNRQAFHFHNAGETSL